MGLSLRDHWAPRSLAPRLRDLQAPRSLALRLHVVLALSPGRPAASMTGCRRSACHGSPCSTPPGRLYRMGQAPRGLAAGVGRSARAGAGATSGALVLEYRRLRGAASATAGLAPLSLALRVLPAHAQPPRRCTLTCCTAARIEHTGNLSASLCTLGGECPQAVSSRRQCPPVDAAAACPKPATSSSQLTMRVHPASLATML